MISPRDKSRTPVEQLKTDYAWFVRTTHRALKRLPTSASDMARVIEEDDVHLLNRFNPGDFDHAPNLWLFLTVLEYSKSREIAAAVASLANCIAVPDQAHARSRTAEQLADDLKALMGVVADAVAQALAYPHSQTREAARLALVDLAADASLLARKLAP